MVANQLRPSSSFSIPRRYISTRKRITLGRTDKPRAQPGLITIRNTQAPQNGAIRTLLLDVCPAEAQFPKSKWGINMRWFWLLVPAVVLVTGCGRLTGETTIYEVACPHPVSSEQKFYCASRWFPVNPVTYKAIVDQQTVIHWVDPFPPSRLSNCVVRDYENWRCEYPDESRRLEMRSGVLSFDPPRKFSGSVISEVAQVPEWQWWGVRLKFFTQSVWRIK